MCESLLSVKASLCKSLLCVKASLYVKASLFKKLAVCKSCSAKELAVCKSFLGPSFVSQRKTGTYFVFVVQSSTEKCFAQAS